MRHSLSLSTLFCLSVATAAPLKAADCSKPITMFLDTVKYTSAAAFPDPAVPVRVKMLDRFEPVRAADLCGVSFRADPAAGTVTVRATSLARLSQVFVHIIRPTSDIVVANSIFTRNDRSSWSEVRYDTKRRVLNFLVGDGVTALFTLGASLDGGSIRPLYYNAATTPIAIPPATKVVDIYVRLSEGALASWQRLTIDLARSSITTYESAKFPSK